jgi:hypothetical protein
LLTNSLTLVDIVFASAGFQSLSNWIAAKVFAENIGSREAIGTRSQMEDSLVRMSGRRARVHIGVDRHDGKRAAHWIARSFAGTMAAINFKELAHGKNFLMTKCPSSTSHSLNERHHSRSEKWVDDQEIQNTA